VAQKNLRLWIHTLLACSMLAVLKGLLTWATIVPSIQGESCRRWALEHQQGEGSQFLSLPIIFQVWAQDFAFGMRLPSRLICVSSFSGPSYLCSLFALGLYDFSRIRVRKLKPHFRSLYQALCATVLTTIVLADAVLDLLAGRQYTLDTTLALVLPLLLYTNPALAIAVDYLMVRGCQIKQGIREGCDNGDVLVPPCCVPFCFLHGRYFIHTKPASQVLDDMQKRAEARRLTAVYQTESEDADCRISELQAQLATARQDAQLREQQEAVEAEHRFNQELAVAQKAHDSWVAEELVKLDDFLKHEQQRAVELEKAAAEGTVRESGMMVEHDAKRSQLIQKVEAARQDEAAAKAALKLDQEEAEATCCALVELEQTIAQLEATHTASSLLSISELGAWLMVHKRLARNMGDFRAMPVEGWVQCYTRFCKDSMCQEGSSDGPHPAMDTLNWQMQAFRSLPPSSWLSIHTRFASTLPHSRGFSEDETVAACPEVRHSHEPRSGDFRSMPPQAWASCYGRFQAVLDAAPWPGFLCMTRRGILVEQTSSCAGGHGDFRLLPQESWSAIHARFHHGIFKQPLPLEDRRCTAVGCFKACPPSYWMGLHSRFAEY